MIMKVTYLLQCFASISQQVDNVGRTKSPFYFWDNWIKKKVNYKSYK
jgi:hypothetical protein